MPDGRRERCEGCHIEGVSVNFRHIHLRNGVLTLCLECLECVNGKNPELAVLRAEVRRLREESESRLQRIAELNVDRLLREHPDLMGDSSGLH